MTDQKTILRQHFRKKRRLLNPVRQKKASRRIAYQLNISPAFNKAKNVAFYLSNDGEIDTRLCIKLAWSKQKNVYLPIINPFKTGTLCFIHYTPNTTLKPNRYGIKEPYLKKKSIPSYQLDWLAIPLVAFDKQGHRLGMGGGFYDRTFAVHKSYIKQPLRVGFAHKCQHVNHLPVDHWDLPLDHIITS